MAIDDSPDSPGTSPPPSPHIPGVDPADPGIVSVNDRGRRRSGQAAPYLMIGGITLVVLIGGLVTVNVVKAKFSGPKKVESTTSASSSGLARSFPPETAPPLPGDSGQPSVFAVPACPDGSAGNELRGQDGIVVRNAAGQSVRVCSNGQVVSASRPAAPAAQPIPVVRAGRTYTAPTSDGLNASQAPADGPMMLNDGRYGVAPLWGAQGAQAGMEQVSGALQPGTEGLLTAPRAGSLEAELTPSRTPMVQAARLSDLNLFLPKGRTIDCGMSVRIISTLAGQASCVVTQNVYSANGKVLLIERGSEAVGEYRSGVSIGQKRLFVLWTRIITPAGVVINLNSPGADELGSTGLTGKVDSHWFERIGSAFLLSTIQDAIQDKIAARQANSGGATFVLGNTAQTGNQMAEKVLEATINIPPTIYKNQGDRAVIYVARDLDFSSVYRLRAKP